MLSLDQFVSLAADYRLVPLSMAVPGDLDTPVSAFLKTKALGATYLFESVEGGEQVARYSFIGIRPFMRYRMTMVDQRLTTGDQEVTESTPSFSLLQRYLAETKCAPLPEVERFPAGAVGSVAYDYVRLIERIRTERVLPEETILADFCCCRWHVVVDHAQRSMRLVTLCDGGDDAEAAYHQGLEDLETLQAALMGPTPLPAQPAPRTSEPQENIPQTRFEELVLQGKEHIGKGDVFQVVLSRAVEGTTNLPPFEVYRRLRRVNPSPYLFFLDMEETCLVGSSPETLVRLQKQRAMVNPIAGTRRRGANREEDHRLEEELLADAKEQAEHVMLVDLGRNDLGRVCRPGTVEATTMMEVERFSHVMHLISEVEGELQATEDAFSLFDACFPAGTVSGAPKARAMEIIDALEPAHRGPYAGAVGYFSFQGDMDFCIAIRTLVFEGERYRAQAGAGIVADSDPAAEYHETTHKAGALLQVLEEGE